MSALAVSLKAPSRPNGLLNRNAGKSCKVSYIFRVAQRFSRQRFISNSKKSSSTALGTSIALREFHVRVCARSLVWLGQWAGIPTATSRYGEANA
jgi:hypothetical protein